MFISSILSFLGTNYSDSSPIMQRLYGSAGGAPGGAPGGFPGAGGAPGGFPDAGGEDGPSVEEVD